jgi:hypothetical protein
VLLYITSLYLLLQLLGGFDVVPSSISWALVLDALSLALRYSFTSPLISVSGDRPRLLETVNVLINSDHFYSVTIV